MGGLKIELINRLKEHDISLINQPQLHLTQNSLICQNQPVASQLIPLIFEEDSISSQSVSSVSTTASVASGVIKEKKTRKKITWF